MACFLAVETPPSSSPMTPRSSRKLPQTPTRRPHLAEPDLWTESVWSDDEFRNRDNERPAAIDQIIRRSTGVGVMARRTGNDDREGERAADIDTAIEWIKSELSVMREQDRKLLKQFTAISSAIKHIKGVQDMRFDEENSFSDSESGDDVTHRLVPASVLTSGSLSTDSEASDALPGFRRSPAAARLESANASVASFPVAVRSTRRRPDRILPATPVKLRNKKRPVSLLVDSGEANMENRYSWC
eukprot:m.28600 g.28600  ORF g.28600 m.28600 type:complete len:244 (+) comp30890_c0_seq1:83-814(+)